MSYACDDAALSEINNEIKSVYDYCLAAGLTHDEILEKAKPLLWMVKRDEWKRKILALLKIGICFIALSYTLSSDTISRSFLSNSRYLMFKMLPYWDWTDLYSEYCLVENPFYSSQEEYVFDCNVCEDVTEIDYTNNTSEEDVSKNYMERNIPLIVSEAMSDWPAMQDSFNILNLTEVFYDLQEDVCMFQSNLGVQSHRKVFEKILNQDNKMWFAHWENCEKNNQRATRKFYSRPYFLPSVVQMTESNWILMSSGYKAKKFKKVDILPTNTVMWLAQLRGYNSIQFVPKDPCNTVCNILQDTIEEGEIVLFSPTVWDFSYMPGERTENLAVAVGGFSHLKFK